MVKTQGFIIKREKEIRMNVIKKKKKNECHRAKRKKKRLTELKTGSKRVRGNILP